MSHRSLIELNHDYCPLESLLEEWARQIRLYIRSGNKEFLPMGMTLLARRHHSDPEFLAENLKLRDMVRRLREIVAEPNYHDEIPAKFAQIVALLSEERNADSRKS